MFTCPQIQDSANFFQRAQEKYEAIKESKKEFVSPEEIRTAFGDLVTSLRKAEEVLVLPRLPNIQEIYTAEQRVRKGPRLTSSHNCLMCICPPPSRAT